MIPPADRHKGHGMTLVAEPLGAPGEFDRPTAAIGRGASPETGWSLV